jgi:hypothetical protein
VTEDNLVTQLAAAGKKLVRGEGGRRRVGGRED